MNVPAIGHFQHCSRISPSFHAGCLWWCCRYRNLVSLVKLLLHVWAHLRAGTLRHSATSALTPTSPRSLSSTRSQCLSHPCWWPRLLRTHVVALEFHRWETLGFGLATRSLLGTTGPASASVLESICMAFVSHHTRRCRRPWASPCTRGSSSRGACRWNRLVAVDKIATIDNISPSRACILDTRMHFVDSSMWALRLSQIMGARVHANTLYLSIYLSVCLSVYVFDMTIQ